MATKKNQKKSKAKPISSRKAKNGTMLMNFKVSARDHATMVGRAKKFCEGNLSKWLRHAGVNYKPKDGRI